MIDKLISSDCIKIGKWKLKNGEISKYYFDMKNIISNPILLKNIGDKLYNLLDDFDIICGIPYGGLPIATYISTKYNKPLIYIRDKLKSYGTQKLIEGEYKSTDRCVIIDDVITSGNSLQQTINIMQDKVNIVDVGVIINRQENPQCSLPVKSILDKIGKYIIVCKIHYDIINIDSYEGIFKEELINLSIKHNFLIMEDRKFVDISYIVNKQYSQFRNWVDLVTVHSSVSTEVISKLSGVLLVVNMSNNTYDFSQKAIKLAEENPNNMVGFITQNRITFGDLICMTPGISLHTSNLDDQKYRNISEVDTDYIIVGRDLYNSENIEKTITLYHKLN